MNTILKYKNYLGSVEFSKEDKLFFGKIINVDSLISYESSNYLDLFDVFKKAIVDYEYFLFDLQDYE